MHQTNLYILDNKFISLDKLLKSIADIEKPIIPIKLYKVAPDGQRKELDYSDCILINDIILKVNPNILNAAHQRLERHIPKDKEMIISNNFPHTHMKNEFISRFHMPRNATFEHVKSRILLYFITKEELHNIQDVIKHSPQKPSWSLGAEFTNDHHPRPYQESDRLKTEQIILDELFHNFLANNNELNFYSEKGNVKEVKTKDGDYTTKLTYSTITMENLKECFLSADELSDWLSDRGFILKEVTLTNKSFIKDNMPLAGNNLDFYSIPQILEQTRLDKNQLQYIIEKNNVPLWIYINSKKDIFNNDVKLLEVTFNPLNPREISEEHPHDVTHLGFVELDKESFAHSGKNLSDIFAGERAFVIKTKSHKEGYLRKLNYPCPVELEDIYVLKDDMACSSKINLNGDKSPQELLHQEPEQRPVGNLIKELNEKDLSKLKNSTNKPSTTCNSDCENILLALESLVCNGNKKPINRKILWHGLLNTNSNGIKKISTNTIQDVDTEAIYDREKATYHINKVISWAKKQLMTYKSP